MRSSEVQASDTYISNAYNQRVVLLVISLLVKGFKEVSVDWDIIILYENIGLLELVKLS